IGPEETAGELETRLAALGGRLALRIIDALAAGTAQGSKQDKAQATKAPKLIKEHGQIDWSRHARGGGNQIRGMQPWPTAYDYWHREGQEAVRIIIHKAVWRDGTAGEAHAPGQIVLQPGNLSELHVAAGSGSRVEIRELQPAGKRRMAAAEFRRGH